MPKKHLLGAIQDPRSEEEKAKDWLFHKVYALAPITWVEKAQALWKKVTQRNQDGSSSCVAHSFAEVLEIQDPQNTIYSAHPVYTVRQNKPSGGMYPQNACDIMKNNGTTTEVLDPSNGKSESQMNEPVLMALPKKIASYGAVIIDCDHMAAAIEQHGAIILSLNLSWKEWSVEPGVPQVIPGTPIDGGHELSGVDYTLWKGEKAIIVKNHWGLNDGYSINGSGYVILTESYLKARCDSSYFANPALAPSTTLRFGDKGDLVRTLQTKLNANGASLLVDGGFGTKTKNALIAFQKWHKLAADGICGSRTWQAFDMIDIITGVCVANGVEPLVGIAVASCESSLNPKATLYNPPSNSTDRGLFMWNSKYHAEIPDDVAFDPNKATKLFCDAVKAGHLKDYWSASLSCWKPKLTPELIAKYHV